MTFGTVYTGQHSWLPKEPGSHQCTALQIEYANTTLGIPVTKVDITSDVQFDATCTGYSWTTTYGAGTDTEYVDVEVRLVCESADGVPYYVLETGSGKDSAHALRRIVRSFTPVYPMLPCCCC